MWISQIIFDIIISIICLYLKFGVKIIKLLKLFNNNY